MMKLGQLSGHRERDIEGPVRYLTKHLPEEATLAHALAGLRCSLEANGPDGAGIDQRDVAVVAGHKRQLDYRQHILPLFSLIDVAKDIWGRRAYFIIWLCGYLCIKESVSDLVRAMKQHPHSVVRNCAAEALGRVGLGTPEVIQALERGLEENYHRTRLHAAWSLVDIKACSSLERLRQAMDREEVPNVQRAMREAQNELEGICDS